MKKWLLVIALLGTVCLPVFETSTAAVADETPKEWYEVWPYRLAVLTESYQHGQWWDIYAIEFYNKQTAEWDRFGHSIVVRPCPHHWSET